MSATPPGDDREWVLATRGGPNGADTYTSPDGYFSPPYVPGHNGSGNGKA